MLSVHLDQLYVTFFVGFEIFNFYQCFSEEF